MYDEARREEDKWSACSFFFQLAAHSVERRADKPQQRVVFWAVCTVSEECTDIRIGDLSAGAGVWHVFHSGQLGRRVARQEPGVAIAALV